MTKPKGLKDGDVVECGNWYYAGRYYVVFIKEISNEDARIIDPELGECKCVFFRVDIYNRNMELLAEDSIITYDRLLDGHLKWYIPNLSYDHSYMGQAKKEDNGIAWKIWHDMLNPCYDPYNTAFPFIGAVGTRVCDRWLCYEYFLADLPHMAGYTTDIYYNGQPYVVDLLDIQKNVPPNERIYAPGVVKLKQFRFSDIQKYKSYRRYGPYYPNNMYATQKYTNHDIPMIHLYKNRTGLNCTVDTSTARYFAQASDTSTQYGFVPWWSNTMYYGANAKVYGRNICKIARKD